MARLFLSIAILAGMVAGASVGVDPAMAQDTFPTKPIRIINPLPAGSAPDVVTRLVGEQLASFLRQPVVVENRPGGGGIIAAQAVIAAPPDGYTLLSGVTSIYTILPAEKESLPFDVNRDLTQVGMIDVSAMALAVPPRLGIVTLPEFIALARSRPHEIVVGTNGTGTLPHFAALALARVGNIPITVVPYATGGTTAAITDILGGRVHATIEAMSGLRSVVRSGDLKLVAVMSPERNPSYPDVPSVAETLRGLSAVGWVSLAAPAGTPESSVRRLNEALRHTLEVPSIRQRFDEFGIDASIMTPAQTKAFIENEQKLWWPIVKEAATRELGLR